MDVDCEEFPNRHQEPFLYRVGSLADSLGRGRYLALLQRYPLSALYPWWIGPSAKRHWLIFPLSVLIAASLLHRRLLLEQHISEFVD